MTGRASFELMFCTRCCSLVSNLLPRLGNIINSKLLSPKHTIGCPTKNHLWPTVQERVFVHLGVSQIKADLCERER